jgi:hypothetical protein
MARRFRCPPDIMAVRVFSHLKRTADFQTKYLPPLEKSFISGMLYFGVSFTDFT